MHFQAKTRQKNTQELRFCLQKVFLDGLCERFSWWLSSTKAEKTVFVFKNTVFVSGCASWLWSARTKRPRASETVCLFDSTFLWFSWTKHTRLAEEAMDLKCFRLFQDISWPRPQEMWEKPLDIAWEAKAIVDDRCKASLGVVPGSGLLFCLVCLSIGNHADEKVNQSWEINDWCCCYSHQVVVCETELLWSGDKAESRFSLEQTSQMRGTVFPHYQPWQVCQVW